MMCEDEIKQVDAWFEQHTEYYGTNHVDNEYTVSSYDLKAFSDVVEVVRCKDCEHGQSYNMFGSRYCLKHNDVAVRDNDFCSYGERKDT